MKRYVRFFAVGMGFPAASKNIAVRVMLSTIVMFLGGFAKPMPRIGSPNVTVASVLPAKGMLGGLVPATESFAVGIGDFDVHCASPASWFLGIMIGLAVISPLVQLTQT